MKRIVGGVIAIVPFAFALIRAKSTGTDFRYFWVACASTVGAALVLSLSNRSESQASNVVSAAVPALIAAFGAAALTAFATGARSLPALVIVGLAFATCSAIGLALAFRHRLN